MDTLKWWYVRVHGNEALAEVAPDMDAGDLECIDNGRVEVINPDGELYWHAMVAACNERAAIHYAYARFYQ